MIWSIISSKNTGEFLKLWNKSKSPEKAGGKFISFAGWKIDVSRTIFPHAQPSEVLEGWNYLSEHEIPIYLYTSAFFISSLYVLLSNRNNIEATNDIDISTILEPETLEVLRL